MRSLRKSSYVLGVIFILLHVCSIAIGQVQAVDPTVSKDSANIYYADYSDLLALRIFTATKWNTLEIHKDGIPLRLKPNSPTSLGVGFNYKSFGLALAFGLPKSASSNAKHGKTKRWIRY